MCRSQYCYERNAIVCSNPKINDLVPLDMATDSHVLDDWVPFPGAQPEHGSEYRGNGIGTRPGSNAQRPHAGSAVAEVPRQAEVFPPAAQVPLHHRPLARHERAGATVPPAQGFSDLTATNDASSLFGSRPDVPGETTMPTPSGRS